MRRRASPQRVRGVALIIALLVLGVVAAVGAMLANEFVLAVRRSQNQLRGEQAWEYLLGAEQLARIVLEGDADLQKDHLGEAWARGVQAYEIEGGWLAGSLEDLQGRFNLGSLQHADSADGGPEEVPANESQRRFVRLLQCVGGEEMTEAKARELTEAIMDWIDADTEETGFGGAEDTAYLQRDPATRAANRMPASLSELRMLPGVDENLYTHLVPEISIWPGDATDININTARPMVLKALAPGGADWLNDARLKELETARAKSGFGSKEEFSKNPAWDGKLPLEGLGEHSDYFLFRAQVEFNGLRSAMESVLVRKDGKVHVIARTSGGL